MCAYTIQNMVLNLLEMLTGPLRFQEQLQYKKYVKMDKSVIFMQPCHKLHLIQFLLMFIQELIYKI